MYVVRKTKSRFESTILIYVCGGGIELLRCTNKGKYHSVLAVHTFISIKLVFGPLGLTPDATGVDRTGISGGGH